MAVVQKIKEFIYRNKFCLLLGLVIITLIFYFQVFFTKGVYFDDVFLKKEVISSENHYRGKTDEGNIHIIVKGTNSNQDNVDVIYNLPNNINEKYTVIFKGRSNLRSKTIDIKDKNGNIVFEGECTKGRLFLLDKKGKPVIQYNTRWNDEIFYNSNYKILFKNVASFATMSNETFRGRFQPLIGAIIIFILTFIDIRHQLFFFTLRNFLTVKNPEPSDYYLTVQRISWYINPVIGVILMIVAI